MPDGRRRTLADEVAAPFRVVVAGAGAMAIVLLGTGAWFVSSEAPSDTVLVIGAVCLLLVALVAGVSLTAVRHRRRMQERIVDPIAVLVEKVRAVGQGEFVAVPAFDAPAELLELRDDLIDMSGSLRLQQQALAARAEEAAANARRLKLVVDFAREVSDSLTLAHCLGVITVAVRKVCDAPRARVWLLDDGGRTLSLRHDSITGSAVPTMCRSLGYGGLGRAAQAHRVCVFDGLSGTSDVDGVRSKALAVPMVKGRRLIGVMEILMHPGREDLPAETLTLVEAMAAQAATAVDAALVHALTASLSLSDPLTGLANRRQLNQDLALEVERAARYDRPLTLLMIDVDHFKAVNDTFGHAVGDAVLSEIAGLLAEQMRAGDTVYRYGGEEFAVLARETDLAGARAIGERLRILVEEHYSPAAPGDVAVTISVGVACVPDTIDAAREALEAADAALYDAKRSGRNRVVAHDLGFGLPEQRAVDERAAVQ
jgi:diguanylate cyclase (GGDEF)-like protein